MTIGSGIGGSFGFGVESSYGVAGTATRFHEVVSAPLKRNKRVVQGGGLSGGRTFNRGARRVVPTSDAGGSVNMEVVDQNMALWLRHVFGSFTAPTVVGGTTAQHQFTFGDSSGLSFNGQVVIPELGGVERPYYMSGGKVTSATFSCDIDGLLMLSTEVDGRALTEVAPTSFVTPTYATGLRPFHGGQLGILFGAYGAEASGVGGIKSVEIELSRPLDTARFYANGAGLKSEPILNDKLSASITLDAEFVDKTMFADRFAADTPTALLLTWQGPTGFSFAIELGSVYFDTDTPTLEGPGVVSTSVTGTCLFDGTNPEVKATYITTSATAMTP